MAQNLSREVRRLAWVRGGIAVIAGAVLLVRENRRRNTGSIDVRN